MRAKEYIEATYRTLEGGMDIADVLTNLQRVLKNRGLEKLYARILKGLMEKIAKVHMTQSTKITVARESDITRHAEAITSALAQIGTRGGYSTQIDESIIGGFIVSGSGKRIDQTHKSTLLHAYHNLAD